MSIIAIATISVFLAVTLIIWWLYRALSGGTDESARRVQSRVDELGRRGEAIRHTSLLRDSSLSEIPTLDRVLHQSDIARRLDILLRQADMKIRVGVLVLLMLLLAAIGFLVVSWITGNLLLALAAALLLGSIPYWVVKHKKSVRIRKFEESFPDALDLFVNALRAGYAFSGAMSMVAEEAPSAVAREFGIAFEEHELGLDTKDCLLNMVQRVDSLDLKLFVTAIIIQRETGGNLAEVLDKIAYVIRERFKILGEVKAYSAQGRFSGMVLGLLPIIMAIVFAVIVPDYMSTLIKDPAGKVLLGVAVVLQILGYLAIKRIVAIKV
jgi:tight adherence protein B